MSKQELTELETLAEKGDVEAALKLMHYYGQLELCNRETREKAAQGDKDAQEMVNRSNKIEEEYDKWQYKAAENGDAESAFNVADKCNLNFKSGIKVKENKKEYRKFMEKAIAGGYKESDYGGDLSNIDYYKKYYQGQSEEWWDSDSIETKEGK